MTAFIEQKDLQNLVAIKKFKEHSTNLQSLLEKIQTDLHKRYTPFDRNDFSKYLSDINQGMSLISIVGEQLTFDLKYTNLEFLAEPFKRVNIFASNILNIMMTVFQNCYRQYLRVADELQKASQSWLPLQFILKQGIRLQNIGKLFNQNIIKQRSKAQDDRDIEQMNDAIQQKKLYLKHLTPVTQPQLFKLQEQVQRLSQMSKNIIDQTFRGINNMQQSINKAWTQQFIKKWRQEYLNKLKQIITGIQRVKFQTQQIQCKRKQNVKHQQTQTQQKPKKAISKNAQIQKLQKQLDTKIKHISELQTQIQTLKNSNEFSQFKRIQEDKNRQQFVLRQFVIKNQKLQNQLEDLKSEYASRTQLMSKRVEMAEDKFKIIELQLEQAKVNYSKQNKKVKELEHFIESIKQETDSLNVHNKTHALFTIDNKVQSKQDILSYTKIQSFKSLGGQSMKQFTRRMTRELRSIQLASRQKSNKQKINTQQSQISNDLQKTQQTPQSRVNTSQIKTQSQNLYIDTQSTNIKYSLPTQQKMNTQGQIQKQFLQQQKPINPTLNISSNIIPILMNSSYKQTNQVKKQIKPRLNRVSQNQIQFDFQQTKQINNSKLRKGVSRQKGSIYKGLLSKGKTILQQISQNQNHSQSHSLNKSIKNDYSQYKQMSEQLISSRRQNKQSQNEITQKSNINSPKQNRHSKNNSFTKNIISRISQPNVIKHQKTNQLSNIVQCIPLIHHKTVQTQTSSVTCNNQTQTQLLKLQSIGRFKSQSNNKQQINRLNKQIILTKKSHLVTHVATSMKQSRQHSFENTIDYSIDSPLNSLSLLNRNSSVKKKRLNQITQFQKIEIDNSLPEFLQSNRFSNNDVYKLRKQKQQSGVRLITRKIQTTTIYEKSLPSVKEQLLPLPISKLQLTMVNYLKLLKKINSDQYYLFLKSLIRFNKYCVDSQQKQNYEIILHRRLLNFLNNTKRCDTCLILRIFVQKLDVIWKQFDNTINNKK